MCRIPASLWFSGRFFFFFTHPTEPKEGLKIDESSQNQFIAPEILCMCYEWEDCVAVLPHRGSRGCHSTEVFDNQGWIVYSCFVFLFFVFCARHTAFSTARESAAAYSDVKCDEILVVTVREVFTFFTDSCISPRL